METTIRYRLVVRQGPMPGKEILLAKDITVLGRDVSNDIVVNDAEVSRTHTRLTAQGEGYLIEDLASTNGTFINGQRLTTPRLLRPGDMLGMGETVVLELTAQRESGEATMIGSGFGPPIESAPAPARPAPVGTASPLPAPRPAPAPQRAASAPLPPPAAPVNAGIPDLTPAPMWKDKRVMMAGGVCGCLTLCLCFTVTAFGIYYGPALMQALGF